MCMTVSVDTVSLPSQLTLSLKWISTNFPNLLLLLFLIVLALPNDSSSGLAEQRETVCVNSVIYKCVTAHR